MIDDNEKREADSIGCIVKTIVYGLIGIGFLLGVFASSCALFLT